MIRFVSFLWPPLADVCKPWKLLTIHDRMSGSMFMETMIASRANGALDRARHELERHVRRLPQHPPAKKLGRSFRHVPYHDGGNERQLRGLPRPDQGASRMATAT